MKIEADLGALAPYLEKFAANQEAALKIEGEAVTSILKSINDGVSIFKSFMEREFSRQDKRDADNAELNAAERKLKTLELQLRIKELEGKMKFADAVSEETVKKSVQKVADLRAQAELDRAEAEALKAKNNLDEEKARAEVIEAKKKELMKRLPKMDNYELER